MSFSFSEPVDIYDEIEAATARQWEDEMSADEEACLHAAMEQCYEAAVDEGSTSASSARGGTT